MSDTVESSLRFEIQRDRGKPMLLRLAPWLLIPLAVMTFAFATVMSLERGAARVGFAPESAAAELLSSILGFALALILLCASYGVHRELPRTRWVLAFGPSVVLFWGAWAARLVTSPTAALPVAWSAIESLAYAGFATWYLFRKSNVRHYYGHLHRRR